MDMGCRPSIWPLPNYQIKQLRDVGYHISGFTPEVLISLPSCILRERKSLRPS